MRRISLFGPSIFAAMLSSAAIAAPLKAVVFDLEYVGAPGATISEAKALRVQKATAALRKLFADSGQVVLIDTAPEAAVIAQYAPLRNCHDCDLDIAKRLGADIEVTTALQQMSDVILGFSGSVRDVKTGKVLSTGLVNVRGDTDENWAHGVKFLVKDRLLDPPLPNGPEALRAAIDK